MASVRVRVRVRVRARAMVRVRVRVRIRLFSIQLLWGVTEPALWIVSLFVILAWHNAYGSSLRSWPYLRLVLSLCITVSRYLERVWDWVGIRVWD
eukprot:1393425-Amorphochlora_amoeboformis.AAC.1